MFILTDNNLYVDIFILYVSQSPQSCGQPNNYFNTTLVCYLLACHVMSIIYVYILEPIDIT